MPAPPADEQRDERFGQRDRSANEERGVHPASERGVAHLGDRDSNPAGVSAVTGARPTEAALCNSLI